MLPVPDTVPPVAVHVTAVLELPVTVAVKLCVPPVDKLAVVGEIVTDTGAGAVTVIVALALFVASATLFAVIVYVPAVAGAV